MAERPDLSAYTSAELRALARQREREEELAVGTCDGWVQAASLIEMNEEGDVIEDGDWYYQPGQYILCAYGWLGGSYIRAHVFDAQGSVIIGWEARDLGDKEDEEGPEGYYAALRARMMACIKVPMDGPSETLNPPVGGGVENE